jgi:membrane associated rhomboid family serine protease
VIPLPLKDDLPRRRFPAVTVAIIGVNALAWLLQLLHGVELSVLDYGLIPGWLVRGMREGPLVLHGVGRVWLHQEVPFPVTALTAMFMHGSWVHIGGNMWFLWIFGGKVEDALGPVKFGAFYLLCGLLATAAHVLSGPNSVLPMVGASGAIAGVLGAYALLYPRARVRCLWILIVFITFVDLRAWLLLGVWFLSQFFMPGPGVAWVAHVGGFVAGAALVNLFAPPGSGRRLAAAGVLPPPPE